MGKRKTGNNLDTISGSIVCTETNIKLTDEKLRSVLSKTYETARKDAQKFKIYKHYGIFLSAAFSIIIPLLTSDFQAIGKISKEWVLAFFWGVFVIGLVVGIVLALIYASCAAISETTERDCAVEDIMQKLQGERLEC